MDTGLKQLKQVPITATNDRMSFITCCSGASLKDTLLLAVNIFNGDQNKTGQDPKQLPNTYKGKTSNLSKSWMIRCNMDLNSLEFQCNDYRSNSMLLYHEYILSICEYATNMMLAYTHTSNELLIIKDWQVVSQINEPDSGNL